MCAKCDELERKVGMVRLIVAKTTNKEDLKASRALLARFKEAKLALHPESKE